MAAETELRMLKELAEENALQDAKTGWFDRLAWAWLIFRRLRLMPTNWGWWLFTIVLGIVLSVIANFLYAGVRGPFKKWTENRRRKARERDAKKEEKFERAVQKLIDDQYYVTKLFSNLTKLRIRLGRDAGIIIVAMATSVLASEMSNVAFAMLFGVIGIVFFMSMALLIKQVDNLLDIRKEYERRKFGDGEDDE